MKTHCIHGHKLTEENSLFLKDGYRRCKECRKLVYKKRDAKKERGSVYKRTKTPVQYEARYILNNAIRSGKVTKYPCAKCGNLKSQGHHENYKKPLDVIWLCLKCHSKHHKGIK